MNHSLIRHSTRLLWFAVLASCAALYAGETEQPLRNIDPAMVLAYRGDVVLTQQEIDAAFSKIPASSRLILVRDGAKVDQLIRTLLLRKALARAAAESGFDREPLIAIRMELEAQKELAEAWLQNIMDEAPAADYAALAHEHYLANPDDYRTAAVLDVSHILLGTKERTLEEAKSLAELLAAELARDPSRFDALVLEHSDDPAKGDNAGRYPEMRRGMMVASFENAAFNLQQPGEISEPVKTEYGYHIIRLNGRSGAAMQEFGEIREEAIARARNRYLDDYRKNYLRKISSDPVVIPEGAVEIMAKRYFGEDLEGAPEYRE
jgi:peptidyl-prolyl cis-trans isomerase C